MAHTENEGATYHKIATTMATFANQSSNLSALSSALSSFSTVLDVSENATCSLTKAEEQENALEFFSIQNRRVEIVDGALFQATEHILPVSREAKTVTELAELTRIVQETTRQKMSLLRTRLELLGVKVAWSDSITSPIAAGVSSGGGAARNGEGAAGPGIQWSALGGPLDCVVEADVETEGATTPGSMLQPSPFYSATKQSRKGSMTPTTPTMNTMNLSSSTAWILEKMNQQQPLVPPGSHSKQQKQQATTGSKAATPSPCSGRSDRQLNFEGFKDDDDMISLNTTLEVQSAKKNPPSSLSVPSNISSSPMLLKLKEERSQFLARMESMLERVEEELIHQEHTNNRPSDETSNVSRKSSGQKLERPSNSKFLEELVEDEESSSDDDESTTNMVATLVAEKPGPMEKDIMRPVPVFRRPITDMVVETTGISSPAHTNITMDATMMMLNDESMVSANVFHNGDDDNDSTVTPVLDRYRLDPDDNSIGIKVVPNRRGKHGQKEHHGATAPSGSDSRPVQYFADDDGFLSPKGLPGSVSARKPKQYRKTPYPKKHLEQSFDDENHPNSMTPVFSPASSKSFDTSNPESSFSVPPLRPRSMGPATTKTMAKSPVAASARAQSLPTVSATLPKTPSAKMAGFKEAEANTWSTETLIEKITMAEYKVAPRVVQMQVTREEANNAIDALEAFLVSKDQTLEFTAQEGYRALADILESEQKSKSVLMSLCHWRRLLMYREADQSMVFAVNTFE